MTINFWDKQIDKAKRTRSKAKAFSNLTSSILQELDVHNAAILSLLVTKGVFTMKEYNVTKELTRPILKKMSAKTQRKITMAFKNKITWQ